jgi:hypothetical protein
MALVLADRVLETTTSTGSGTITLAGAEPGYQSFAVVGNANQTYYTIAGDTEWEVGIGTYTSSGTALSRDTVLSSSASGAKVGFSAGQKKVFVTYPSEKSVNFDLSGNITAASGRIINLGAPSLQSDAATKEYVDNMSSAALHIHEAVVLTTPADSGRNDNYNNGTAGVSATLTATANGTLVIDSTVAQAAQRVLIKDCDDQAENGIYVVTTVGTASTPYVMTRSSDADTSGQQTSTSLDEGSYFFTTGGTTQKGAAYVCNTAGTITFGTTPITFAEFSQAQVYSAGNGISITLGSIALNTPVTVASGGTGLTTSPANGQLLIGNGSNYTLSTLTAGSGVSITNSAGSITLSATGLGGTVTAVTATGPLASSGGTTPDISIANSTGTGSVVLDQGATISSATITAAVSASITTITGTSANITTVTGTTAGFSSANITQLGSTSATIATLSGTNVTFSSGTISQLAATSATIATVSGTNATYSNGSFTSATVTTVSGTTATYTSATVTNLNSTSANITTLTGTTFGTTATTQLRGASAQITTATLTNLTVSNTINGSISGNAATATTASNVNNGTLTMNVSGTGLSGSQTFTANQSTNATFTVTSNATSANTANTIIARDASCNFIAGDVTAQRPAAPTTGVIYFGNTSARYLYWDSANYHMPGGELYVNGTQVVKNSGTWSISISGNAATVTNGLYTTGNQTIAARTIQQGSQNVGSMLTATGSLGGLELYSAGSGNAAFMTFHRPGAYASYFGIDTDNQFAVGGWSAGGALANFKCLSLGVGTAASGTSGEIRATNNVTAYYSDARLKDFKGKIGDALYKVSQLNGYYYTENEKAEEFGFNNKKLQVGVSAQEVKAILPEVIAPAPFDMDAENKSKSGEDYMTVRYEKLVPLLIEAIKELKAEVEALKAGR